MDSNSSDIDMELGKELLFRMKRIRAVEETIAERYSEWKMRCPTHLSIGQEAVGATIGMLLRNDDFAVSGHRAHAHYLGKGGDLKALIAELYGKATGCSSGKGGSMHLVDTDVGFMGSTAIVGNSIPVGVGLALSAQLHKTDQVSCAFFGDGAVEEGVFYESANFAIVRKLPVLFVCENNLYSVYSPWHVRQPIGRKIHEMVRAFGMAATACDGNDATKVYRLTKDVLHAIRHGSGPQFIEFSTYRWREHCGPNYDNDLGYRTEEEFLEWKALDPIPRLISRLGREGKISSSNLQRMDEEIQAEIDDAFCFAEESPFPDPEDAYRGVYKEEEV